MDAFGTEFCETLSGPTPTTGKQALLPSSRRKTSWRPPAWSWGPRGWSGSRAFTPTSGPGISLMSEFIGLRVLRRDPESCFFDVQRDGPLDGDAHPDAAGRHHDRLRVCLARGYEATSCCLPVRPEGMLRVRGRRRSTSQSASRLRSSYLSDLDIGMNDWMIPASWSGTTRTVPTGGRSSIRRRSRVRRTSFYRYAGRRRRPHSRTAALPGVHPKRARSSRAARGTTTYARRLHGGLATSTIEVVDRLLKQGRVTAGDAGARSPRSSAERRDDRRRSVHRPDLASVAVTEAVLRGASTICTQPGLARWTTCASGASRSMRTCRGQFLDAPRPGLRHRAEPRRAAAEAPPASPRRARARRSKLQSITYYGGQPLSKGHVLGGLAEHIEILPDGSRGS